MNSRQRVRAVLNHEIPDLVPSGLGGCETTGLHVVSYDALQQSLGLNRQAPRINTFMCNAVFELEMIKAIEGDILLIASPRMCKAPLWGNAATGRWKKQCLWGKSFRVPEPDRFIEQKNGQIIWENENMICLPGSYYFDWNIREDLYATFDYPSPDNYDPTDIITDEFLRYLEETTKFLYKETEYSLSLGETIVDLQFSPGGMVGLMVLMAEEPNLLRELLQKNVDRALKQLELLDQAVGKYVDILSIAHDLGDNRCVIMGPDKWRTIYKPFYRQLFQGWRERTNIKINLHACGSIESILGDLIECGLHIYNPVQISGCNMSPDTLKARFGKDLIFWGGDYDAQLMWDATPEDVYTQVSQNLRTLMVGGGHIFSGVHNLPANIPESHLRAMLQAWQDNRRYT